MTLGATQRMLYAQSCDGIREGAVGAHEDRHYEEARPCRTRL